MIVEWLLDLMLTVVDWLLGLVPPDFLPSFVKSPPSELSQIAAQVEGMGVWVPWGVVAVAAASSLGVWGVLFVIKVIRQLFAHVPQIGGAG